MAFATWLANVYPIILSSLKPALNFNMQVISYKRTKFAYLYIEWTTPLTCRLIQHTADTASVRERLCVCNAKCKSQ